MREREKKTKQTENIIKMRKVVPDFYIYSVQLVYVQWEKYESGWKSSMYPTSTWHAMHF